MSQATGAPTTPKTALSECGKGMPWFVPGMWIAHAKSEMPSMMALKRPTSATKEMSMMATLKASWPPSMVPRATGGDEVFVLVLFVGRHLDGALGSGEFCLGHQHFGDEYGAGGGHDDGREQVLRVDAEADVGGHDAARNVGHAGGHDRHKLGAGGAVEEWADGERGFGLTHEDAGGNVGGFGAGSAHGALHDPGDDADDVLHEANVVHDGEEGADEDDGRQHGEGEGGERVAGCADAAEDERGAVGAVAEQAGDDGRDVVQDGLTGVPLDDQEGEDDLQREAPGDGAPADGAAIGGEGVGETGERR